MRRQIQRAIEHGLQTERYSERTRIAFFLFASAFLGVGCFVVRTTKVDSGTQVVAAPSSNGGAAPPGMIWIAGGEFTMGTNDVRSFPNERPAHRVRVEGFWIDEHDVTNAGAVRHLIPDRLILDFGVLFREMIGLTVSPFLISGGKPIAHLSSTPKS